MNLPCSQLCTQIFNLDEREKSSYLGMARNDDYGLLTNLLVITLELTAELCTQVLSAKSQSSLLRTKPLKPFQNGGHFKFLKNEYSIRFVIFVISITPNNTNKKD